MSTRILDLRLVLATVLLPAMMISADSAMLSAAGSSHWSNGSLLAAFALFLAQGGVLSYTAGRWMRGWGWRLTILGWFTVLVDLLLYSVSVLAVGGGYHARRCELLVFGFYASQVSLGVIWAVLGNAAWRLRLAAAAFVMAPAAYCLMRITMEQTWDVESWLAVAFLQAMAVLGLCGLLRAFGYRIETFQKGADAAGSNPLQFSIGHMLIWTVAAALIVSAGKQVVIHSPGGRDWTEWLQLAIAGVVLAMVALAAMWTVLGAGRGWLRASLGLCLAASAGGVLWYLEQQFVSLTTAKMSYFRLPQSGPWWMAWPLLAGPFLAGLLLVFQPTGYRLIRRRRAPI